MIKKFSLLICLLTISQAHAGGLIAKFTKSVKEECSGVKSLVIKKVLLEIVSSPENFCDKTFSKRLTKKCSKIDCESLSNTYSQIIEKDSGHVVGQ